MTLIPPNSRISDSEKSSIYSQKDKYALPNSLMTKMVLLDEK